MDDNAQLNQFLTFTLSTELFALNIGTVKEVLEYMKITNVPRTPEYMRGVINLRGHAVPIVDMRAKFGMQRAEVTVDTCIIVCEIPNAGGEVVQIGALADSVNEVVEINQNEIEPPPNMGLSIQTRHVRGIAKHGDDFVLLLDVEKLFSAEELASAGTEDFEEPGESPPIRLGETMAAGQPASSFISY